MKRTNILSVITAFAFIFSVSSCDFDDTNIDPGNLNDAELSLLLPSAIMHLAYEEGGITGRTAGMFIQYFEGRDAQQLAVSQYNTPTNTFNGAWNFNYYGGSMKDLNLIIEKSSGEDGLDAPYYRGIAKVLMAQNLGMLTTIFGDVPYSDAFKGDEGNVTPAYDTQEEIFATIQRLLDEGIQDLATDGGEIMPAGDDFIHGGDPVLWTSTAHSLKARYYMTLSKRDPNAAQKALDAINAGAISSNLANAYYQFDDNNSGANPYFRFNLDRTQTLGLSPTFISMIRGSDDPRTPQLVGESGVEFANLYWTSRPSQLKLITFTEVKFIEAEAHARLGNTGQARTALEAGIRANMNELGVANSEQGLYLLGVDGASLATIINEKYKAIFPQSLVAWTDYRRTGFPALSPFPGALKTVSKNGEIPRRGLYVEDEVNYNIENVNAARTRQGFSTTDPDSSQDLWAFKD